MTDQQLRASLKQIGIDLSEDDIAELQQHGSLRIDDRESHVRVLGVPGLSLAAQQRWLGLRMSWWPREALEKKRIAVLSSRLAKDLGQHAGWFDALRTLLCQLDATSQVLITAAGTTADPLVRRAAMLFGLPCFECRVVEEEPPTSDAALSLIFLSPPLIPPTEDHKHIPAADLLLASLATQLRVLRVRSGSKTEKLLLERLNDDGFPMATTFLARTSVAADTTADKLTDAGAIPWILVTTESQVSPPVLAETNFLTVPPFSDYLLHWTRGPDGSWPDEPEDDYLDRLILGVEASGRTAFAALTRIVQNQKLLAGSKLIRGGHSVVCFTQTDIANIHQRRLYRQHLRRWDFEPYGIGVRKSALVELGTRAAIYGEPDDYDSLPEVDQAFFQRRATGDGRTQWTAEDEWRHVGDLDLSEFALTDVFAFVPTTQEAAQLARVSPWQVVVVPTE